MGLPPVLSQSSLRHWQQVVAFSGQAQLAGALTGMDLVVIPAGVPRKPGMTVSDQPCIPLLLLLLLYTAGPARGLTSLFGAA